MSESGMRWFHLILSTHGSWLPGDPRGFRSRGHRIHSSGDYKHLPPPEEHHYLFLYQKEHASPVTTLPSPIRPRIARAFLAKAEKQEWVIQVMTVGATHAHLLIRLPNELEIVKKAVGQLKQASSHAVRDSLPGKIWAEGGKPIIIKDEEHKMQVIQYILEHEQKENAFIWKASRT